MQTDTLQRTSVTQDSQPASSLPPSAAIAATAPGHLRVIKRNGTVVSYDDSKIAVAMTKAFLAVEGGKQVAVLAPTTILAQQHLQTFRHRLRNHPVRVEWSAVS